MAWWGPAIFLSDPSGASDVEINIVDGVFTKTLRCGRRAVAATLRVYARLAEVLPSAPPALRLPAYARAASAEEFKVVVEMPVVAGREATAHEVMVAGAVLDGVAAAVAWLARRRVVYLDVRAPNVLVDDDGAPGLVDFDDCVIADEPVETVEAYREALAATRAGGEEGTFAWLFAEGAMADVEAAFAAAFERAEASS